nr:50S ribosomal protein L30 [Lachnospiraceae bacterium]
KVTLVKSLIGQVPKNKNIAQSMGLRKIGQSVVLPDNDATKGQVRLISHMVKVEEA